MSYVTFTAPNQALLVTLAGMLPDNFETRVEGGRAQNKNLEKLRQFLRAMNRPTELGAAFKHFTGISPRKAYNKDGTPIGEVFVETIDPILDQYVMAAAKEQGLLNVDPALVIQQALEAIRKRSVALETAQAVLEALTKEYRLIPA